MSSNPTILVPKIVPRHKPLPPLPSVAGPVCPECWDSGVIWEPLENPDGTYRLLVPMTCERCRA